MTHDSEPICLCLMTLCLSCLVKFDSSVLLRNWTILSFCCKGFLHILDKIRCFVSISAGLYLAFLFFKIVFCKEQKLENLIESKLAIFRLMDNAFYVLRNLINPRREILLIVVLFLNTFVNML